METIGQEIYKDPLLAPLSKLAKEKGMPLYLVGGYLRDLLLGTHARDYDFVLPKDASSSIERIEEALGLHFFKVGKEQAKTITYRVIKEERSVDITFLQGETIEEDLKKRDFTINAMAFSLKDDTFHRVAGSLEDIERKLIRAVSNDSIDQDPVRMLRAVRYLCSLEGFVMEEGLIKEIFSKKRQILKIAGERIKTELDQIALSSRAFAGTKFLCESSLLLTLFPELGGLENLGQGDYHHLNVLSHTLLMMEKIAWALEWTASRGTKISLTEEDRLVLYYAALVHDIGKQDTYSEDEKGGVHFYAHPSYS